MLSAPFAMIYFFKSKHLLWHWKQNWKQADLMRSLRVRVQLTQALRGWSFDNDGDNDSDPMSDVE